MGEQNSKSFGEVIRTVSSLSTESPLLGGFLCDIVPNYRPATVEVLKCILACWVRDTLWLHYGQAAYHPSWKAHFEPTEESKSDRDKFRITENELWNPKVWNSNPRKKHEWAWSKIYLVPLLGLSRPQQGVRLQAENLYRFLEETKRAWRAMVPMFPIGFCNFEKKDCIDAIRSSYRGAIRLMRRVGMCDIAVEITGESPGQVFTSPLTHQRFKKSEVNHLMDVRFICLDARLFHQYKPHLLLSKMPDRSIEVSSDGIFAKENYGFGLPNSNDLLAFISHAPILS